MLNQFIKCKRATSYPTIVHNYKMDEFTVIFFVPKNLEPLMNSHKETGMLNYDIVGTIT